MKINDFTNALESKYGISSQSTSTEILTESVEHKDTEMNHIEDSELEESCDKSLIESEDARPNHSKFIDMLDIYGITSSDALNMILKWLPDDEIGEIIEYYDFEESDLDESCNKE